MFSSGQASRRRFVKSSSLAVAGAVIPQRWIPKVFAAVSALQALEQFE
jgi:hypothetical protein